MTLTHLFCSMTQKPRYAILACILGAGTATMHAQAAGAVTADVVVNMSLTELRTALDNGTLTSEKLVSIYLARINTVDRGPDGLRAVLAVNEQALAQAQAWDAEHARTRDKARHAPLSGIPFLAKDNFDAVGMANTGGSLALRNSIPSSNAFVVQRLLNQGAILLGKTNLSELAASYGRYGYSSVGGQTLNPFNPLRTADGSSSGSATAVAAKLAPFALGTDTTGSIRSPASVTGTVGMRTTMGLVSRSGIIPMSLTADAAGAITRTVADQAIVLDAIQAEDKSDVSTVGIARPLVSLTGGLASATLHGKRIAVVDNFDGANAEVDAIKKRAVDAMARAGATIAHIRLPAVYETLQPKVLGPIGLAEFTPQFETYLNGLAADQPKTLRTFIDRVGALTENGSQIINPGRYKGLLENLDTRSTDSPAYIKLLTLTLPSLREELSGLMSQGKYDALFFPTMGCTAPVVPGKADSSFVCNAYAYAAAKISPATGFPEITVNGGRAMGNLPVGMSMLGAAGSDANLLAIAAAFERLQDK
ncbi:MAG: amidase family protein [Burkholderiaceae bacterium]